MGSVASQLIEEVTAHVQRDSLEDAREICADGTYFLNNLRITTDYWIAVCLLFKSEGKPQEWDHLLLEKQERPQIQTYEMRNYDHYI